MRRHVSAEILALHREGAVSPRKAERITAHLSVCAVCTEVNYDLGTVTTVLAATQLAPMPESLAARIQLAIAQEAAMRAATVTAAVTAVGAAADFSGVSDRQALPEPLQDPAAELGVRPGVTPPDVTPLSPARFRADRTCRNGVATGRGASGCRTGHLPWCCGDWRPRERS